MSSRAHLRRSAKRTNFTSRRFDWAPDVKEELSDEDGQISTLNREAYPADVFAKADDMLVFTLFVGKGKKRRHHAIKAESAQGGYQMPLSKEAGKHAAQICQPLFNSGDPSWEAAKSIAFRLQEEVPDFRLDMEGWGDCLSHLIFRYSLLISSKSPVAICKVTYDEKGTPERPEQGTSDQPASASEERASEQGASFGLKATCNIPAGVFLKETCSSMSLDVVEGSGPSIILSSPKQMGMCGKRLILGPFRLINHDCEPNAQIFPILHSHACVVTTIKEIPTGEHITVKYDEDGYFLEGACRCMSCTNKDPLDVSVLKPKGKGEE